MNTAPAVLPGLEVLSVAEMSAADLAATQAGVQSLTLMENAGAAVAMAAARLAGAKPIVVLCGPGNNGGDGFVAARILREAGHPVRAVLYGAEASLKGDAAINAQRWRSSGGVTGVTGSEDLAGTVVIDALFGAGLNRPLSGAALEAVRQINAARIPCVAVDVPSGVAGDSGDVLGEAPQCAVTVTFFREKPAHLLYPARAHCGEIILADIGIPPSVLSAIAPACWRNAPGLWTLPAPGWRDHKYSRGAVLVIGGSMTGAARLAGRAARRVGAGLLTYAAAAATADHYAGEVGALLERITAPADLARVIDDPRRTGILIGPGLGRTPEARDTVLRVLASDKALVLDADALTLFGPDPGVLFSCIAGRAAPVVITPHGGEFHRLFGASEGRKLARARAAARLSGATVVFKGADTVVADPKGRAAISLSPPWLATGGTGDVLAGLILGLLGQGMGAFAAANAGAWLHGAAAASLGRGMIAEDLPEALPAILKSLPGPGRVSPK